MNLTEDQKNLIRENFRKNPDLRTLTQLAWGKDGLDGRSMEGRSVRQFLSEEGLEYKTTFVPQVEKVELTESQKKFLLSSNVEQGMKALEVARLVFKDSSIVSLSMPHRVVQDFLREYRPEVISDEEETNEKWKAPTSLSRVIKKINDWTGSEMHELRMAAREKKACEALLKNMCSKRLASVINGFSLLSDRELFESEFIRSTWDKPDLTADEMNLYITVCANYVRQKHVQIRLDKINKFVQESNEPDIHMRVTEQLKATSEELNGIEKRIESLINKLNGDRAQRLSKQAGRNVSILALVEAFQSYEERERMVRQAEMERELVEGEIDRLESMDAFKARVLGITREELL